MERQDRNIKGPMGKGNREGRPDITSTTGPNSRQMEALGFKEGKLFTGPERATLTFFMGNEVASIHFDLNRREIFFKGHNVKNMTLTQDQWEALGNFHTLLQQGGTSPQMVQAYRNCLNQVLPRF